MSGKKKATTAKYAAIGYVVSKFAVPIAKRSAKKKVRGAAKGAVDGTAGAVKRNPARTSVAVGSLVGALGWIFMRNRGSNDESDE